DAAHELKTSLAILKSTMRSLMNRPREAPEYERGLQHMSEDSDRLEDLLNRMLRLARVEQWAADGIHRALEMTDIAYTCEMAVARINALANEKNVKVTFTNDNTAQLHADSADLELIWI